MASNPKKSALRSCVDSTIGKDKNCNVGTSTAKREIRKSVSNKTAAKTFNGNKHLPTLTPHLNVQSDELTNDVSCNDDALSGKRCKLTENIRVVSLESEQNIPDATTSAVEKTTGWIKATQFDQNSRSNFGKRFHELPSAAAKHLEENPVENCGVASICTSDEARCNILSSKESRSSRKLSCNQSRKKSEQSFARRRAERNKVRKTLPGQLSGSSSSEEESLDSENASNFPLHIRMPVTASENTSSAELNAATSNDIESNQSAGQADDNRLQDPWVKPITVTDAAKARVHFVTQETSEGLPHNPVASVNANNIHSQEDNAETREEGGIRPAPVARNNSFEVAQINSDENKARSTSNQQSSTESEFRKNIRNDLDLLSRPSWCDARFALSRVEQGRAKGNIYALKFRAFLQQNLHKFGCFIQRKAATVLFIGVLILGACAVGLKLAHMETNVDELWVETGGQLEEELAYTKFAMSSGSEGTSTSSSSLGSTLQMLIQTGADVATKDSLLFHYEAAKAATEVSVAVFNQTWQFSDLCYKLSIPTSSEDGGIDFSVILDRLLPCFIITPLDCFWEGAKLLGPRPALYINPTLSVTWANLRPLELLDQFLELPSDSIQAKLTTYKDLMLQAGVTTGYTERWCLDPHDPECPTTAPNHDSKATPDVKSILSQGCSGFATNLMQWPIDLIVGDIKRDSSSTITNARGLETLFRLMSAQNMYQFHKNTVKTGNIIDWSEERALQVLSEWQREYVKKIYSVRPPERLNSTSNEPDTLYAFTAATADDILLEFSNISFARVIGGYLLMMGYACLSLMRMRASRSQGAVGVLGVLLVALSVAAGLGISSVIGISFNAASTQVLPFLLLGLGVDDMFLMAHHFGEISVLSYIPFEERTGECLKRVGVSVFLTSVAILSGFLFSLIIPMPALRAFGLQAAIVTVFNLVSVLIIFPAILSLDLKRRKNNKLDILCCFDSSSANEVIDLTENAMQSHTCSHTHGGHRYPHVGPAPGVHNPGPLPGNNSPPYQEGSETTITMHHTIQAYSNRSYVTVRGPTTETSVRPPFNSGYSENHGTLYNEHPRTPPPEYTASTTKREDEVVTKPTSARPKVAFVNEAISGTSTPGRSTPASSGVPGRISRRGHGSNPPTNLTTPMESVRSSTHSLVPHKRRKSGLCCFGAKKRSGALYACLATLPSMTVSQLGERYYAPFLMKNPVRVIVIILFCGLLGVSIYGCTVVEDGLDFGDVLPRGTREHAAIVAQTTYFSFYNMYIVTKKFNYHSNQEHLYRLHHSVGNISYVVRETDGSLNRFWLEYFRDWLQVLQDAFDEDWTKGFVNETTWTAEASDNAILAFKLLRQTGEPLRPTDISRIGCKINGRPCERVDRIRLVSDDGIIPEDAFYNYLSAWVGNDPLSYEASQAVIIPQPESWLHEPKSANMYIPRSPDIIYAQMPYYLNGMRENQDFVNVITWVRGVCESIAAQTDIDSYPSGYPFTYWQQYIDLRFWLFISLGCVIVAVFIVLSVILFNPWASAIMAIFLAMISAELLGFMGATNVKLSAVPAVILVAAIGLGVEFTVHITFAYLTCCGTKEDRVKHSIGHMLGPVVDGAISTLLGIVMLAGAEFDFIITYFFQVLAVLIALGVLNGLVLLPVVLSLIGPPPEVVPVGGGARLKTPTPPPSPPAEEVACNCHSHAIGSYNSNCNNNRSHVCHCHRRPTHYCSRNHYSSRDDLHMRRRCGHSCYGRGPANNAYRRPHFHNFPPHYQGEGFVPFSAFPSSNVENGGHTPDQNTAWQQHPFEVPPSNTGEGSRVYVYPHAEYVVYSRGDATPNEQMHDLQHCENPLNNGQFQPARHTNDITSRAASTSQGESVTKSNGGDGKQNIPTLTATSSLTVKVHSSGRQPVVAFVEPSTSSTSSSRVFPNLHQPNYAAWGALGEGETLAVPQQRRRFDISALNDQRPGTITTRNDQPGAVQD
ncbi:unnamed protein product [Clavelina lepadiformis]|uniref:SSD domain-containing protein n=3 Tax=Clavelina lepadiformis TaxID=159417 RepID=A0ABP0F804_CLALP